MVSFRQRAEELDKNDPLSKYRDAFYFPKTEADHCVYFTGNSLGLQPKTARDVIDAELRDWADFGVEGHFDAEHPWYSYHELLMEKGANLVGAKRGEVVHMNGLTVNIHFLMVSFYRPTPQKYKIICEAKAFPSDQYALESQVKFHGFDPGDAIVEVGPRSGEHTIREEDIEAAIEEHKDELALVFWGGVNYYTGQFFDIERITKAAHTAGVIAGFDFAHGAGNVPLELHKWDIDFAAWCTYKYLNSGPGSVSGVFINEKHGNNKDLIRFAGWWGHDKESRFKMEPGFNPVPGAEGWQLSNAPIFSMAPHLASLEMFAEVGMNKLREKSIVLTGYLRELILDVAKQHGAEIEIITPEEPERRGCQLSILVHGYGRDLFVFLQSKGVFADWREPNVIRVAPVPLYNSFMDCYRFGELLGIALEKWKK